MTNLDGSSYFSITFKIESMQIPGIPARAASVKLKILIGIIKFVRAPNKLIDMSKTGPPIPDFKALKIGRRSFKVRFIMYKTTRIPTHKITKKFENVKFVSSPIFSVL